MFDLNLTLSSSYPIKSIRIENLKQQVEIKFNCVFYCQAKWSEAPINGRVNGLI